MKKMIIDFSIGEYKKNSEVLKGIFPAKIVSLESGDSNYPIKLSTGECYSLRGKSKDGGPELHLIKEVQGPCEDGRLIYGQYTFALRLLSFLEITQVNDAASQDEKDYLIRIAEKLLWWQRETVTDESELEYLERTGVCLKTLHY